MEPSAVPNQAVWESSICDSTYPCLHVTIQVCEICGAAAVNVIGGQASEASNAIITSMGVSSAPERIIYPPYPCSKLSSSIYRDGAASKCVPINTLASDIFSLCPLTSSGSSATADPFCAITDLETFQHPSRA
ncbi:hypothetical protein HAX54_025211 [Datura stramonium]|uniref:Uncharacterized protein n=1 Tax=Datura stramonium TaxID=4076 RepID=A0ABS8S6A5_DATST|nr:hypothetical protein [Datura stramonium]